ncbi:MAG: class I SAM-dependent methyltransferase [Acidimicrobiaceae bacterium]|nr:class I SAM-dependent methyltransferase [Acidimicrobiaceae bacterium]
MASELWENNAKWWQIGFTNGADPEYQEQIIPMLADNIDGSHSVLDIGTGEGQLSRVASATPGVDHVVGIDPTWEQISEARARAPRISYLKAEASAVPFADGSFDTVIACLVFEHIADLDGAIGEVARVLKPGGRFLFFLNHPLLQTPNSGWIDDHIIGEQYWRIGKYLEEERSVEEVEKDVYIPFIHRPLSKYLNTLASNSLLLTRMEEPSPPQGFLDKAPQYYDASFIPRLLFLRLTKV